MYTCIQQSIRQQQVFLKTYIYIYLKNKPTLLVCTSHTTILLIIYYIRRQERAEYAAAASSYQLVFRFSVVPKIHKTAAVLSDRCLQLPTVPCGRSRSGLVVSLKHLRNFDH